MKKIVAAFALAGLFAAGCKEVPPDIILTAPTGNEIIDTVAVPAADAHNVLVEEFTGQGCSNCPAAHATLEAIQAANPGRVNVVGLYVFNIGQTVPPAGAIYDFRSTVATTFASSVYNGVVHLPAGGVDRLPLSTANPNNTYELNSGEWGAAIPPLLSKQDTVNLAITSAYNTTSGYATISVSTVYLKPDGGLKNISVVLVEDSLIDLQEDGNAASNIDTGYVFMNVFRDFVSAAPFGDVIGSAVPNKMAGLRSRRTYSYKVPASVKNVNNCRLIAFVSGSSANSGHTIYQSAQTRLVP